MSKFTIAVTGGRSYQMTPEDWGWLYGEIGLLMGSGKKDLLIIHGGASGADSQVGAELLTSYQFPIKIYPANWKKLGKLAGPLRNIDMAEACDLLLAFPGGRGTQHMIDACRKRDKPVHESPTRLDLERKIS